MRRSKRSGSAGSGGVSRRGGDGAGSALVEDISGECDTGAEGRLESLVKNRKRKNQRKGFSEIRGRDRSPQKTQTGARKSSEKTSEILTAQNGEPPSPQTSIQLEALRRQAEDQDTDSGGRRSPALCCVSGLVNAGVRTTTLELFDDFLDDLPARAPPRPSATTLPAESQSLPLPEDLNDYLARFNRQLVVAEEEPAEQPEPVGIRSAATRRPSKSGRRCASVRDTTSITRLPRS
jgi:hypothetical protein